MDNNPLTLVARKLETRGRLDADDLRAVMALPHQHRRYEAQTYLVREGQPLLPHCSFVMHGFAFRQKVTSDGARQIMSIHMRGDFLDLQHLFLKHADHNVQALTRMEVVDVDRHALEALLISRPAIAHAMWVDALVDGSIFREWLVNIGRRDARARIAHLLCEVATRMALAGIGDGRSCELPMTQEQIGDTCGLTSVHVNRVLKGLAAEGIIQRDRRSVSFTDWDRISEAGDFDAGYLHLDQCKLEL